MAVPLFLARVARSDLARINRAHRNKAAVALPGALRLTVALAGMEADSGPLAQVKGRAGNDGFVLHAPWTLVEDLVHGFAEGVQLGGLPGALRGLMLEAALREAAEALESGSGLALLINAVEQEGEAAEGRGLLLKTTGGEWLLRLDCSASLWDRIAGAWPVAARDLDWLPVPGQARLGDVMLGQRVLTSLRPGDVLLAGAEGLDRAAARLVLPGQFGADMAKVDTDWMLTEAPGTMDQQGTEKAEDASDADLDDIPVKLSFDLGQVEVPMGQLREMGAGTIIDLGRPVGEVVGISANGQRIGRGELVDIDGTLGVRITRIFGRE